MTDNHLPALQIIIPLIAAPLCLLLRQKLVVRVIATSAAILSAGIAWTMLFEVLRSGTPITYYMGGWVPPKGIEYRVDILNGFVLAFVSTIAPLVLIYAPLSVMREVAKDRIHQFYAAFMLALTGLLGITITGDAFNVFVFLEISSISSYVLIGLGTKRQALTSAFRYLVMGTLGGTFILISIGLLYMNTGTLNMADMAKILAESSPNRTMVAAFAFFSVGVVIKAALFPLHAWLPGAYANAPSVVSAFLAATATKVGIYVLLRFGFTVFGADITFGTFRLDLFLMPMALGAILFGSAAAIYQKNVKRLLAYSSIAQIGYMILGISMATETGLTGSLAHLFNHALIKSSLFLIVGCFSLRVASAYIEDFKGLGKEMPVTGFCFVLAGLSLIGVPMTTGFVSKWFLVQGSLDQELFLVTGVILISSLMSVIYVWKIVEVLFFKPREVPAEAAAEAPWYMLAPILILVLANIYLGIDSKLTAGIAQQAAQYLMGVSP